jgi:hypothetical protein
LVVALALAVLVAAPAHADGAPASAISSPADPLFAIDQGQAVTIAGTFAGAATAVDILCYHDDGSSGTSAGPVATGVAVGADGSWQTTVALRSLVLASTGANVCRLRAVPAGTAPTAGLDAFAGPRVAVGQLQAQAQDFQLSAPQLTAADQYSSFGACGLAHSYLLDPVVTGQVDGAGFGCADFTSSPAQSDQSRPGIEVDGQPAYAPATANAINPAATGQLAVSLGTVAQNPRNGDLQLAETEPLVRCMGDPFPATAANCSAFVSSGVQLQRTIEQTDEGHVVKIDDSYTSSDGSAHSLSLLLGNDQDGASGTPEYQFPGQSSFAAHQRGDAVTVPSQGPGSILIDSAGAGAAITYAQPPSGAFLFSSEDGFDAPAQLTVPSSGSATISYAYATEPTVAAAREDALSAEDRFAPPAIAFTAPLAGALTADSPVTVTGTATASSGVSSVTVNGVTATLAGDTFTAAVPLAPGPNALMAVLVTNSGATASATETVAFALGPQVFTDAPAHVAKRAATLRGSLTAGTAPVAYAFQFGTTIDYGRQTGAGSLPASSVAAPVRARISGLRAGTIYHYRLVAFDAQGTSYGSDATFRTALATPRRLTVTILAGAGDRYTVSGALLLPAGISKRDGCNGYVALSVKHGRRALVVKWATVTRRCRYRTTVSIPAARLRGRGRLSLSVDFLGSAVLAAQLAGPVYVAQR